MSTAPTSTRPAELVPVFDVEQVAELLRCSAKTVRAQARQLGGLKLGADWIFPAGALARALDQLAAAPAPALPAAPAPAGVLLPIPPPTRRRDPPALPQLDAVALPQQRS